MKFLEIDKHFPKILIHYADEAEEIQQNIMGDPAFATSMIADRCDDLFNLKRNSKKVGSRIVTTNATNKHHYAHDPFIVTVKHPFTARNELELTAEEGETVRVIHRDGLFLKVKVLSIFSVSSTLIIFCFLRTSMSGVASFLPTTLMSILQVVVFSLSFILHCFSFLHFPLSLLSSALSLYPGPPLPPCPRVTHREQDSEHTQSHQDDVAAANKGYHCSAVAICEFRAGVTFSTHCFFVFLTFFSRPEGEGEINFLEGDVIHVHEVDEATGWWQGTVNGRTGSFPGGFVVVTELSQDTLELPDDHPPVGEHAVIHSPVSDDDGEWEDGEWIDDDWEEEGEWEQGEIIEGSPATSISESVDSKQSSQSSASVTTAEPSVSSSPSMKREKFPYSARSRNSQEGRTSDSLVQEIPETNVEKMSALSDKGKRRESGKDRRESPKKRKEKSQDQNKKTPPPRPFREKRVPIPPNPKGDTTRIISTKYRNDLEKPLRPPPVPTLPPPPLPLPLSLRQPTVSLSPSLQFVPLE